MSRTRRDILVIGRSVDELKIAVKKWFHENHVTVICEETYSVKGQWGSGFLTGAKFFQVYFKPIEGGVVTMTEGWVTSFFGEEIDYIANYTYWGGIPRREGWQAIERLWAMLQSYSLKPPQVCSACGQAILIQQSIFCQYCGKPLK
jgi:hypothetical protein